MADLKGTAYGRSTDFRKLHLSGEGYRMEAFTDMFPTASEGMKSVMAIVIEAIVAIIAILASYGITKLLGIETMMGRIIFYSIIALIGFIMVYWTFNFFNEINPNATISELGTIAYHIFMGSFVSIITILGAYTLVLVSLGKSSKTSSHNFFGGSRFPY